MHLIQEGINWIEGTPVGIDIRGIDYIAPHFHEDVLEIFCCLRGSVLFSFGFEEFVLEEGEFLSVDKDVHYIYKSTDNICASIYIDLTFFEKQYPYIKSLLFVCEGLKASTRPYPTKAHEKMRGYLTALLLYVNENKVLDINSRDIVTKFAGNIIDAMLTDFDILFYYRPGITIKPVYMERYREMMLYLYNNYDKEISVKAMTEYFNLTNSYISELFRRLSIGFRKILGYTRACIAARMLLTTELNIMDISEACGFSDTKYLYKSFSDWYKCTPKQYRDKAFSSISGGSVLKEIPGEDISPLLLKLIKDHYFKIFIK